MNSSSSRWASQKESTSAPLDEKVNDDAATRALSFRNYFYVRNDRWAHQQTPYLAREYERIMARLRHDLFARNDT